MLVLHEFLGLKKFTSCDPRLTVLERTEKDDHVLFDMSMNTEPGIVMPFFILAPRDTEDPADCGAPAVIIPHGHGSDGRFGPAGIFRHPDMAVQQEKYNHDLGVQFVRRGYLAICPDARGSGDRRNPEDQGMEFENLKSSSCDNLNNAFIQLGTSLAAAWCWDLMALTSAIVDQRWGRPGDMGVCGFSGGGAQALMLAALDERIGTVGVSGYFHDFEDALLVSNLCGCNFIPGFAQRYSLAHLGELIAPRPLIIEKGIDDPLNGIRGIEGPRELVSMVKENYKKLRSPGKFEFSLFEGAHRFDGRAVFPFFERHLMV